MQIAPCTRTLLAFFGPLAELRSQHVDQHGRSSVACRQRDAHCRRAPCLGARPPSLLCLSPSVFLGELSTPMIPPYLSPSADMCFIPSFLCCVKARRAGALGSSSPIPRVALYEVRKTPAPLTSRRAFASACDWPELAFESMCTQLNMSQFCCFHESLTQHHGFCDIAIGSHPRQPPRLLPWWHGAPSTTPLINCPNVS